MNRYTVLSVVLKFNGRRAIRDFKKSEKSPRGAIMKNIEKY